MNKFTNYTEEFEDFWFKYPPRVSDDGMYIKVNKHLAFEQWRKLPSHAKVLAMEAVERMKPDKYIKDSFRWLRDRGWEDYQKPRRMPQVAKSPVPLRECMPEIKPLTLEEKQQIARERGWKK